MKAAVFALLLLLSLNQGEALRCNICFGRGPTLCNSIYTRTCPSKFNACAAVVNIRRGGSSSSRSCMTLRACKILNSFSGTRARCCTTDLCN